MKEDDPLLPGLFSTDLPLHGCYGRQCWLLSKRRLWWKWGGNWWRQPAKRICQSKWVWVRPWPIFRADRCIQTIWGAQEHYLKYTYSLWALQMLRTPQDHCYIESGNPEGFRNAVCLISKGKLSRKQWWDELLIAVRIKIRHSAQTKSLMWLYRTLFYIYWSCFSLFQMLQNTV